MEFLGLFNSVITTLMMMDGTLTTPYLWMIVAALVCVALFVLQGVGIYTMAKKRNMKKRWLAFVPFASIWYIGKLAGACDIFGQKVKNIGLFAMIAQILCSITYTLIIAALIYLVVIFGEPLYTEQGLPYWTNLSGFGVTVEKFYNISSYIISIIQLISEILMLVLMIGLYKRYYPKNYFALGMLALFIPLSRYIVVFVLRNRPAIDFEAYMRARREAYIRRTQYYGGYEYRQNPYTQNNQPPHTEDPFSEFGSAKKAEKPNSPQNDGSAKGDENPFDDF